MIIERGGRKKSIEQYNSIEEHNQQEAESTEDPDRKPRA